MSNVVNHVVPVFSAPTQLLDKLKEISVEAVVTLGVWHKRIVDRDVLSRLTEEQIKAVGLDPDLVQEESEKPFWVE